MADSVYDRIHAQMSGKADIDVSFLPPSLRPSTEGFIKALRTVSTAPEEESGLTFLRTLPELVQTGAAFFNQCSATRAARSEIMVQDKEVPPATLRAWMRTMAHLLSAADAGTLHLEHPHKALDEVDHHADLLMVLFDRHERIIDESTARSRIRMWFSRRINRTEHPMYFTTPDQIGRIRQWIAAHESSGPETGPST